MRLLFSSVSVAVLAALSAGADVPPGYTYCDLIGRPFCELEAIYRQAEPGRIPCGFMRGHVVFRPDDFLSGVRSKLVNFSWQGKHIHGDSLINQFRGFRLIRGQVEAGESWLDGRPAHILNYQHTSLLWHDVRDETREVSPGVYVGAMYLRRCPEPYLKVMFVLRQECE